MSEHVATDYPLSAYEAALADPNARPIDPYTLTPAECRNGIRNLAIEYLGIRWARPNLLRPYGSYDGIPDADLPKLYKKAQADTYDVLAARERAEKIKACEERAQAEADRVMTPTKMPGWPRALGADLACAYVALSISSMVRLRRAGDFPRPIHLAPRRLAWLRDDLDAWLEARAKGKARVLTGGILDDLPDA